MELTWAYPLFISCYLKSTPRNEHAHNIFLKGKNVMRQVCTCIDLMNHAMHGFL